MKFLAMALIFVAAIAKAGSELPMMQYPFPNGQELICNAKSTLGINNYMYVNQIVSGVDRAGNFVFFLINDHMESNGQITAGYFWANGKSDSSGKNASYALMNQVAPLDPPVVVASLEIKDGSGTLVGAVNGEKWISLDLSYCKIR